jgi:hypothetical protein
MTAANDKMMAANGVIVAASEGMTIGNAKKTAPMQEKTWRGDI